MTPTLIVLAFLAQPFELPPSAVVLNGERVAVAWNDGDSFGILQGKLANARTRLQGYNALESYGPVHQWGDWLPMDLLKVTKEATHFARSRVWNCEWEGTKDHYGRLLVKCPDLIEAMVGEGFGHLLEIEGTPDQKHLAAQHKAIAERRGMWAKGVPEAIITSIHSAAESQNKEDVYNRVVDVRTGMSQKRLHEKTYEVCEKVCMAGSCLLYVPFDRRYGPDREKCLRTKGLW